MVRGLAHACYVEMEGSTNRLPQTPRGGAMIVPLKRGVVFFRTNGGGVEGAGMARGRNDGAVSV